MLTITKLADAEYLHRPGRPRGRGLLHGRRRGARGLAGPAGRPSSAWPAWSTPDQLRALLLGRDPATDAELLGGAGRPRTVTAFDVTFSAPKSVSLLWAFASPEVASVASIAHVEAVAVALDFLERRAGATRQQIDGERQRIPTGMAAATFVHRTSREGDPQLHTHCVVANLGRRPDGTYAALDATPLYEWGQAAGSVYQEELRRRLTERLGVEWGPDRHGCREMAGFDPGWLRTFSKRTQAIEEHLAGAGPENPDPKQRMRADEAASLATRPRKDGSLTPEVLRERWQAEADEIGMPTGHALEAAGLRPGHPRRCGPGWNGTTSSTPSSNPSEGSVPAGPGSARPTSSSRSPPSAPAASRRRHRGPRRGVPRLRRTPSSWSTAPAARSPQYSTVDHLLLEGRVLDHARRPADTAGRRASTRPWSKQAIAAEAPGLGADQADAVRALCAAGPAIRTPDRPGRVREDHHRPRRRHGRRRRRAPGRRSGRHQPGRRRAPPGRRRRP